MTLFSIRTVSSGIEIFSSKPCKNAILHPDISNIMLESNNKNLTDLEESFSKGMLSDKHIRQIETFNYSNSSIWLVEINSVQDILDLCEETGCEVMVDTLQNSVAKDYALLTILDE